MACKRPLRKIFFKWLRVAWSALLLVLLTWWPAASDEARTLHEAARDGDLKNVVALLRSGTDPCGTEREGDTALMEAVANGRIEVVQHLLEFDCDLEHRDRFGNTALIVAVKHDKQDLIAMLLEAGASTAPPAVETRTAVTLLDAAVGARNHEIVRDLIADGWSPDHRDGYGFTPLIELAEELTRRGYSAPNETEAARMAETLLEMGADPNVTAPDGKTALHYAVISGRTSVVAALLDGGADPDLRDDAMRSPLFYAMTWNAYLKDLLFSHGASRLAAVISVTVLSMLFTIVAVGTTALFQSKRRGGSDRLKHPAILAIGLLLICPLTMHMAMRVDFWLSDPFVWVASFWRGGNEWIQGPVFRSHADCVHAIAPASIDDLLRDIGMSATSVQSACFYAAAPNYLWPALSVAVYALSGCIAVLAVPGKPGFAGLRNALLAVVLVSLYLVLTLSFPAWLDRETSLQTNDWLGVRFILRETALMPTIIIASAVLTKRVIADDGRRRMF